MATPVTSTLSSEFARYWRRVTRWIPIESGNYPYVTARVRAKKAALLLPDVYERMLQMEIPQIARILSEGAYKAEILALATKASGVDLIELATSRNLAAVYTQIIEFSEGELRQMIGWYLDRFDVQNVKTIVRGFRRGRPRNPQRGAGRDGVLGRERPGRSAPRLRAHGRPFHAAQGPAGAGRRAAGPISREAPSPGGGSVRPRVPAIRPCHPGLHRAEGPRGPEPADHRPGEGERLVPGRHPRTLGDLRWNSPPSAGTNSSRDSSSPGSARPSAWPETSWKRRSRRSWRTRTSES